MFTIYGGKTEFVQWELGQKVVNPDMCDCEQVVFTMSNGRVGVSSAYEYEGQMVADVPNHLLKYDGKMKVDLGQVDKLRIDERTFFNVVKADEPEGYVCTDNCNLKKKYLETTEQALTDAEKAQVRKNIGAGEGSGGVSSWNDLTDKPFGETTVQGDTLTWDGNTEGLVCVADMLYKVSDATPTAEEFGTGTITLSCNEKIKSFPCATLSGDSGDIVDMGYGATMCAACFVIIPEEAVGMDLDGVTFSEAGCYVCDLGTGTTFTSLTIPGYTGFTRTEVKTIDPEYLPGAVVLYTDGTYLCSDSAATERITKAQLREMLFSGRTICVALTQDGTEGYMLPDIIGVNSTYGFAKHLEDTIYTAEYTAE